MQKRLQDTFPLASQPSHLAEISSKKTPESSKVLSKNSISFLGISLNGGLCWAWTEDTQKEEQAQLQVFWWVLIWFRRRFACKCDAEPKLPSGCKGKECVHVTTALIQAGKIKIRAADRRICGYHHQKGSPTKEQKAECLTKLFLNIRSHPICKLLLLIHKSFAHYLH